MGPILHHGVYADEPSRYKRPLHCDKLLAIGHELTMSFIQSD